MESQLPDLDFARQALDSGAAAFRDAVDRSAAAPEPPEGRWSVLQIAEHVAVVEGLMLGLLLSAEKPDSPPAPNPQRERLLANVIVTRRRKVAAPEMALPAGRYATVAEAVTAFNEARRRTLEFVDANSADSLRALTAVHPVIGPLNGFELLLVLAGHPARHAEQIRELSGESSSAAPATA